MLFYWLSMKTWFVYSSSVLGEPSQEVTKIEKKWLCLDCSMKCDFCVFNKQLRSCGLPNSYMVIFPFLSSREIQEIWRIRFSLSMSNVEIQGRYSPTNHWIVSDGTYRGLVTTGLDKYITSLLLGDFGNDNWNVMFCTSLERDSHVSRI